MVDCEALAQHRTASRSPGTMATPTGRGSPPASHGTNGSPSLGGASGPSGSPSVSPGGLPASLSFASYHAPTGLQHQATHLAHTSAPSLTGELLRQALSEYLRTQVCHVTQVVVLYGWNHHGLEPDEEIPITAGKLCYAAITQCEVILIDRQAIGKVS